MSRSFESILHTSNRVPAASAVVIATGSRRVQRSVSTVATLLERTYKGGSRQGSSRNVYRFVAKPLQRCGARRTRSAHGSTSLAVTAQRV